MSTTWSTVATGAVARLTPQSGIPQRIEILPKIRTQAKDVATGQIFPFGLSPTFSRLNADQFTSVPKQLKENAFSGNAMAQAARQFTLLPHFRYKDGPDDPDATGSMPENLFEKTGPFRFVSRKGIDPSDAVIAAFTPNTAAWVIECSIAVSLIKYRAVLSMLGPNKFNERFSDKGIILSVVEEDPYFKQVVGTAKKEQINTIAPEPNSLLKNPSI
jgi:hypothetical protein